MKWLVIVLMLSGLAFAQCIEPTDGMVIAESVNFCSSTYDVPSGITVTANGIVVDCGTAILRGVVGESEIGLRLENVDNVVVRNCNIVTFSQGLYLKNVTNSLIEDNAFLKNRIGVRLLDSFENTFRDNSDKSFQVAVSAINSKYNIVMLGNKEIERAFCEVNACNEFRDMNVCESGDFYCSQKCSFETDSDCAKPAAPSLEPSKEPEKTPVERVEELIEEAEREVKQELAEQPKGMTFVPKQKLPFGTKIIVYAILYAIAFIVIRTKKR